MGTVPAVPDGAIEDGEVKLELTEENEGAPLAAGAGRLELDE